MIEGTNLTRATMYIDGLDRVRIPSLTTTFKYMYIHTSQLFHSHVKLLITKPWKINSLCQIHLYTCTREKNSKAKVIKT